MKKKISALIILMVLLTACNNQETIQTEETLKSKTNGGTTSSETQKNIDLKNTDNLLDFLYENYEITLDRTALKETMKATYGDFNQDEIEDVVYYSPERNGFYEVPFITVKDGKLALIPNDLDTNTLYSHEVDYDGQFIYYTVRGGGTGISATNKELYVFNGKKIVHTGASLQLEGYISAPPNYSTETKGITTFDVEGDYTSFTHEVITTGSEESSKKQKFIYNPDTFAFTITDTNTTTATNNNVYLAENLKPGVKVSNYFKIKDFYSGDMGSQSISFTLEGNDFVSGTLSAKNKDCYYFKFDEPIIDKNILVTDITNSNGEIEVNVNKQLDNYYIDNKEINLDEDIVLYLLNKGELKAKGLVKEISYEENMVDSMRKTIITELIID